MKDQDPGLQAGHEAATYAEAELEVPAAQGVQAEGDAEPSVVDVI